MSKIVKLAAHRTRHDNLEGLEPQVDDDGLVTLRVITPADVLDWVERECKGEVE